MFKNYEERGAEFRESFQRLAKRGAIVDLKSFIDIRRTKEPDLVLFVAVLILAGIGIAMSYSASAVYAHEDLRRLRSIF